MATDPRQGPGGIAPETDEELAAKWRERALVDAPIAFRAMIRAVNEVTNGTTAGAEHHCAGVLLRGFLDGKVGPTMRLLAQVMETANHDDWWRDSFSTVNYAYMDAYGQVFLRGFGEHATAFANDERSVADLLAEGRIADELRWRGALAAVWLTTPGLGFPAGAQADETSQPTLVVYHYCISLGIVSFKRSSGVKFIAPGQSRVVAGLPYTLVSLLFGWWGIPWGPIWTIETIGRNLGGGTDVTQLAHGLAAA